MGTRERAVKMERDLDRRMGFSFSLFFQKKEECIFVFYSPLTYFFFSF